MKQLTESIMENMKQTDSKLGLELVALFTEALLKSPLNLQDFFKEKINSIVTKMESPIFIKD